MLPNGGLALLARRRNPRGLEAGAGSRAAGERGQLPSRGRAAGRIALHGLPDAEPVWPGRRPYLQDAAQVDCPQRVIIVVGRPPPVYDGRPSPQPQERLLLRYLPQNFPAYLL